MSIGNICQRDVVAVDQGSTLQEAAQLMREEHVGALVVTVASPQGMHVTGMITDRDLAIEGVARALDMERARVSDIAGSRAVAIPLGAGVPQALATMRNEGVRRLLVVGPAHELVGLVALDDLIQELASEATTMADVVRHGIARETVERPPLQAGPLQVPVEVLASPWRPSVML